MFFRYICVTLFLLSVANGYPSESKSEECLNYCGNNGVCVIIDKSPQCYCLPEWKGDRCEDIREYDPNNVISYESEPMARSHLRNHPCTLSSVAGLCKNGGLCQFSNNSYSCACPPTHIGKRCDMISPCNGYCKNGGLCTVKIDLNPECICNGTRFGGNLCHVPEPTTTTIAPNTTVSPLCEPFLPICGVGSTCEVVDNEPVCRCPPGFTGKFCDEPQTGPTTTAGPGPGPVTTTGLGPGPVTTTGSGIIVPPPGVTCDQKPCLNGRTCYNNGNSYFCHCGSQFQGINCQFPAG